ERPDTTWSDWSAVYRDATGSQIVSPKARFIQWRVVVRKDDRAAQVDTRLDDVSLAYLPRNVAPEVLAITTLPPGVGLQPGIQVPPDPNIESAGLDPTLFGVIAQMPPRRLYQRGARSLQWQAEDRNGDTLEYAVYYRALNENTFRILKDKLRDSFYTVDGASLADGRYVFRIIATDAPDNPEGQALAGERISEPIEIDTTPPAIRSTGEPQVSPARVRAVFDAEDLT